MKKPFALILLLLSPAGRAAREGELRLPAGKGAERGVTVDLGFGTVSFPTERPGREVGRKAGEKLACNRGTFHLSYDLAVKGGAVRPARLSVRVRNLAEYYGDQNPLLEEHERGHQRINEAGGAHIEKALSVFAAPGKDLKAAERRLQERFRKELKAVQALHAEWDATSVFTASGQQAAPEVGGRDGAGPAGGPGGPSSGDGVVEGVPPGTGHQTEQGRRAPHPTDIP